MKRVVLLLTLLFTTLSVSASECTKYLCDVYSNLYDQKVKIVSHEEFVNEHNQKIGDFYVSQIVYGYGYMKRPKCKRQKITYITLLDCDCNPIWGYVIPR